MSLQVWLPLNGTLENQGLSNITVTNNGATVDNNGKIGKCYAFNGSSTYIKCSGFHVSTELSIACWSKTATNGDMMWALGSDVFNWLNLYNSSQYCLNSGDNTNNPFLDDAGNKINCLLDNQWHHFCVTFTGLQEAKIYIDGQLKGTAKTYRNPTMTSKDYIYIGGGYRDSHSYDWNGSINDFRVYDHCLSAKEIGELAKGLILHYRLAGPGQPNLVPSSSQEKTFSNTIFNAYAIPYDNLLPYAGQQVTLSAWVKSTTATDKVRLYIRRESTNVSNTSDIFNISSTYSLIKITGILPATLSTAQHYFALRSDSSVGGSGQPIYVKNVKIEQGSVATPWCPNSADTLYDVMGYNNNIEYDCSGYRRNGTKSGTITWDIDSPRYATSYKWPAATSAINTIQSPVINLCGDEVTMNIWFKSTSSGGNGYQMPFESNSRCYLELSVTSDGELRAGAYVNGVRYVQNCSNPSVKDGKWHMLTITYDGKKIKRYVDSIAYVETSIVGTLDAKNESFWLGVLGTDKSYYNSEVLESDARIYATALSAEDIQELYHSAVIVDNTGKSYAYEYFEAN